MSAQNARVTVAIRCRPSGKEVLRLDKHAPSVIHIYDPAAAEPTERAFPFDKVFYDETSQQQVFDEMCRPLVDHCFDGFNSCCFAYGQTGSGKTYSIFGEPGENRGIVPRAIEYVFETVEKRRHRAQIAVFVSFLEIYMDDVGDLAKVHHSSSSSAHSRPNSASRSQSQTSSFLVTQPSSSSSSTTASTMPNSNPSNSNSTTGNNIAMSSSSGISNSSSGGGVPVRTKWFDEKLEIRENANGTVFVQNLSIVPVHSVEEVMQIVQAGTAQRATFETQMNAYSSRSHTIFTITIVQTTKGPEAETTTGMLNLVDLAGSERLKRSESEGQRMKEAVTINKSLSTLGNVILGLDSAASYIHYRDSKLTRILQDSLGGNSFTTLLATIYPTADNYEECVATLQFAKRCKNVQNFPRVNYVELSAAAQENRIRKLQDEIARMKEETDAAKLAYEDRINTLTMQVTQMAGRGFHSSSGYGNGGGGSGSGGDGISIKAAEAMERDREVLNKRLEDRKVAFKRAQEKVAADAEKHRQEVNTLRERVRQLEEQLVTVQQASKVEIEARQRALAEEMSRVSKSTLMATQAQDKWASSLPEALKLALKASVSPQALANSGIEFTDEKYRALLRHIEQGNLETMAQIRNAYESFMAQSKDEVSRFKIQAGKEARELQLRLVAVTKQRDLLYQLCRNLVHVVESGKSFPKHTGGCGIVMPEWNQLLPWDEDKLGRQLSRSAAMVKEVDDPLRPTFPRSGTAPLGLTSTSAMSSSTANSGTGGAVKRPSSARVRKESTSGSFGM